MPDIASNFCFAWRRKIESMKGKKLNKEKFK
jgi:hypothetical protein